MDPLLFSPLPSPREMAAWDRATIDRGTPSLELMERAGRGVGDQIAALRSRAGLAGPVLVLCGPGNNGGDGLVVVRALKSRGIPCRAVVVGAERYTEDFRTNMQRLVAAGDRVSVFEPSETSAAWGGEPLSHADLERLVASAELIVDALLGTGQREAPHGAIGKIVEIVGRAPHKHRVVAVDIPSGVNAESGAVYSPAMRADVTVAIQCVKRGLMQYPARAWCGEIAVIDIGIKPSAASQFFLLTEALTALPQREASAHKGHFGHVTVVGGSISMPGAPVLAATAALRMGAGWVSLARPVAGETIPEVMMVPLEATRSFFVERDVPPVLEAIKKSAAVVIGPGLGRDGETELFLRAVLSDRVSIGPTIVLDADALNVIAADPKIGAEFGQRRVVLTPHPGEAARLLGSTSEAVQADRFGAAAELSRRYNTTVVLKGAGTIVFGGGQGYVCPFGTPYLATPGSGDVLAGMIGALGGQGFDPVEAACRGVIIHARAGEAAHRQRGGYLIASDIIDALGSTVRFS